MPFIFRPSGWLLEPLGHEGGGTTTLRGDHASCSTRLPCTPSVSPVAPGSHSQSFRPYTLPSSRSQQRSHIHMSSWSRLTLRSAPVRPRFWVMCPLCRLIWPGRLSLVIMLRDHCVLDRNSDREGETTHLFVYHLSLGPEWGGSWLVSLCPLPTVGAHGQSPRVYCCPHRGHSTMRA